MTQPAIIVLEDDPFQCERIVGNLSSAFPDCMIVECATESEFRQKLDKLEPGQLVCAVLDAMVPWDFPNENMAVPPTEVQTGGMFRAGKRCMDYARKKFGPRTPICIHTILDREDAEIDYFNDLTEFVGKQPENGELVKIVSELRSRSAAISQ